MNLDDIKIYLPKYLSTESERELYKSLQDFPNSIDQRMYTTHLKDEHTVFQGDGLHDLPAVNLPDTQIKKVLAIVLSNTCDIDPANKRNFPSQIVYAPIVGLKKYTALLKHALLNSEERITGHLESIRKQYVTQILYLPRLEGSLDESIVFLDRVYHISNDYVDRDKLKTSRVFTLSDYGNYLFLFKLSLHFTRIQDKVERKFIQT